MKRFLLIFALLTATAAATAATPDDTKSRGGAHIAFDFNECDFGDANRRGGDLVCDFPFTNDGAEPLVIMRVVTSCSCLQADYSRKPVAPGARGTIRVIYQPNKTEPGRFHKVIQIISNSEDGLHLLTVQGNSIDNKRR